MRYAALVVTVLVLVLNGSGFAQNLDWKRSSGLEGGTVTSLLHAPNGDVFAGTEVGLFVSRSPGVAWELQGIRAASVNGLARRGDTLYAGIGYSAEDGSGGVFRSTDGGTTWTKNLTTEYVWCVAASESFIVAGTDGNGVFVSNSGADWKNGLAGMSVYAVTVRGSTVYAGTESNGVYASADGGATWTNVGLTNRGSIYGFCSSQSRIVACGDFGVSVWTAGTSWGPGPGGNDELRGRTVWCVAMNGDTLYAGTDSTGVEVRVGTSPWRASDLVDMSVYAISVREGEVVAGARADGVFVSTDGGNTFNDRNTELTAAPIRCFLPASDASSPSFAAGSGIAISENRGSSWQWLPVYAEVYALMEDKGTLYAATDDGFLVSTDGGLEWVNGPLSGDTVYAVLRSRQNLVAGLASSGVVFSSDNGSTWNPSSLTTGSVSGLTRFGNRVIAVSEEGRVLMSTDDGKTFSLMHEVADAWFTSVAVVNNSIVVGVAGDDVLVSSDSGATWQHRLLHSILVSDVNALSTSRSSFKRDNAPYPSLFASAYASGVYESTDGGMNWSEERNGLPHRFVLGVCEDDRVVMAGLEGSGVYVAQCTNTTEVSLTPAMSNPSIVPQPASNLVRVTFDGDVDRHDSRPYDLAVVDACGMRVAGTKDDAASASLHCHREGGSTVVTLDVVSYPSGVYSLIISGAGTVRRVPVVVIH